MSNHIATSKQALNISSSLFLAHQMCTDIVLTQTEESKFSVELLIGGSTTDSLLMLKGLDIQIIGKETFTFIDKPRECLKIKIDFTAEEDWVLEEDVKKHLKKYGYRTPTQILLNQAT